MTSKFNVRHGLSVGSPSTDIIDNSGNITAGSLTLTNDLKGPATFIIDPENTIQHVTVNNLNVGRSPEETLRVLDALQTGELCACNRSIGGETL